MAIIAVDHGLDGCWLLHSQRLAREFIGVGHGIRHSQPRSSSRLVVFIEVDHSIPQGCAR